jgi:hypothetical protein
MPVETRKIKEFDLCLAEECSATVILPKKTQSAAIGKG